MIHHQIDNLHTGRMDACDMGFVKADRCKVQLGQLGTPRIQFVLADAAVLPISSTRMHWHQHRYRLRPAHGLVVIRDREASSLFVVCSCGCMCKWVAGLVVCPGLRHAAVLCSNWFIINDLLSPPNLPETCNQCHLRLTLPAHRDIRHPTCDRYTYVPKVGPGRL